MKNTSHNPNPHATGFTLMEVLIALGVLTLGIVAVASLFPVAALLQKEAVRDTLRQNHIRSIDATLEGIGLDNVTLLEFTELVEKTPSDVTGMSERTGVTDPASDVFALAEIDATIDSSFDDPPADPPVNIGTRPDVRSPTIDLDSSYLNRFTESIRSLPTITPADASNTAGNPVFVNREVFWVPFVRRGPEASQLYPDWSVYAFVFQPEGNRRENGAYAYTNYTTGLIPTDSICANPADGDYVPKVFRIPVTWSSTNPNVATPSFSLFGRVRPGDKVLGDNGEIYRIAEVQPPGLGNTIAFESSPLYAPIGQRDLTAIWVSPAPNDPADNNQLAYPEVDIRLLSNSVVRAEEAE